MIDVKLSDLDMIVNDESLEPAWIGRSTTTEVDDMAMRVYPPLQEQLTSVLTGDRLPDGFYRSQADVDTFFGAADKAYQLVKIFFLPNLGNISLRDILAVIKPTGQVVEGDYAIAYVYDKLDFVDAPFRKVISVPPQSPAEEDVDVRDHIQKGDILIRQEEGFAGRYQIIQTDPIFNIFMLYLEQVQR